MIKSLVFIYPHVGKLSSSSLGGLGVNEPFKVLGTFKVLEGALCPITMSMNFGAK